MMLSSSDIEERIQTDFLDTFRMNFYLRMRSATQKGLFSCCIRSGFTSPLHNPRCISLDHSATNLDSCAHELRFPLKWHRGLWKVVLSICSTGLPPGVKAAWGFQVEKSSVGVETWYSVSH